MSLNPPGSERGGGDSGLAPVWAAGLAAVLAAWLVLLLGAVLVVVAVFIIASDPNPPIELYSVLFYLLSAALGLIYLALTVVIARAVYRWSRRQRAVTVYVIDAMLLIVLVMAFPTPFTYTVVAPG